MSSLGIKRHKRSAIRTWLLSHWLTLAAVIVNALMWSWLLTVEVAELSESLLFAQGLAIFVWLLITAFSSTAFIQLIKWLRNKYKTTSSGLQFLAIIFFSWALVEFLVAWLVAVIWYGNNGSLDSVLPFSSFTPWLMYSPFGILSRLFGYYGLSALFVTLVSSFVLPKARKYAWRLLLCITLLTCLTWAIYNDVGQKPVKVVLVAETLETQTPTISTDAELVVLPEYGLDDINSNSIEDRIGPQEDKEVFFVGSQLSTQPAGLQNMLIFGSTKQGFIAEYPKTRLIPGGEYLPAGVEFTLRATESTEILENFELTRSLTKGDEPVLPFKLSEGVIVGAEACASIIAPHDYRTLTKQGATLLTNSASLEIFNSPVFMAQHGGLSRFMATANARPFVQSANDGPSFALDHNGKQLARIDPVMNTEVTAQPVDSPTLYTFVGDWPVLVGLAYIIWLAVVALKRKLHKIINVR